MKISVIIPVYNEEKNIERLLKSIKQSTFTPFEIIIVDSKSTDNTKLVAESIFPDIIYIYSSKSGPAEQRNFGSNHAKGDIFCFIDADTVVSKIFLEKVNRFYNKDFKKRKNICIFPLYIPNTFNPILFIFFLVQNILFLILQFFKPMLGGMTIVIPRDLFFRADKFSEEKRFEDLYLAHKIFTLKDAKVRGPVGYVYQSMRRFRNPFIGVYVGALYLFVAVLNIFNIHISKRHVYYSFEHKSK